MLSRDLGFRQLCYDPFLAFWFSSPTAAQITEQMVVQFNDVLESAYGSAMADVQTAFQTTDWTLLGGIPLNVLRVCQHVRRVRRARRPGQAPLAAGSSSPSSPRR
jgi:hypothetical protein